MASYFGFPYAWRPPADEVQLQAVAEALAFIWPPELKTLYLKHDGTAPERWAADWEDQWQDRLDEDEDAMPAAPFLMSLEEVAVFYKDTQDLFPRDVRFFWQDDNSNYAGLYVAGPLSGMVCVVNHDGGSFVPAFRQLQNFLTWLVEHPEEDVFDESLRTPLFPTSAPDPFHDEEDWERAQVLYAAADQAEDNPRLACAMSLTPYNHSAVLLPYLNHPDFYVVERAVNTLSLRRYEPAYERIRALAEDRHNSSNGAAARAIQTWQRG